MELTVECVDVWAASIKDEPDGLNLYTYCRNNPNNCFVINPATPPLLRVTWLGKIYALPLPQTLLSTSTYYLSISIKLDIFFCTGDNSMSLRVQKVINLEGKHQFRPFVSIICSSIPYGDPTKNNNQLHATLSRHDARVHIVTNRLRHMKNLGRAGFEPA